MAISDQIQRLLQRGCGIRRSTQRFALLLLCAGVCKAALGAAPSADMPEPFRSHNLTIHGYNYTDTEIGSFEVNGAGGGNVSVSSPTTGGSKSTCCALFNTPLRPNKTFQIKWTRDGDTWCEQQVPFNGPVPAKPEYMEVHFYRDGRIEVAVTEESSPPRLQLERADAGWRYAERERERNVNNDARFSRCQHGYF